MDPSRKRRIRLVVALSVAVLLATALVYTSFSASSEARTPSQLARSAEPGRTYTLEGKVTQGSVRHAGRVLLFSVQGMKGGGVSVPVRYTGAVPDPFREGRQIVVDVVKRGGTFVGQPDSLTTKCPSKFKVAPPKA